MGSAGTAPSAGTSGGDAGAQRDAAVQRDAGFDAAIDSGVGSDSSVRDAGVDAAQDAGGMDATLDSSVDAEADEDAGPLSYLEMLIDAACAEHASCVTGTLGDDMLYAGAGSQALFGFDGNDTLDASSGSDVLDGGEGNDVLLASSGDDYLYGGPGDDELDGSSGHDYLEGGPGDDILDGSSGTDTIGFRTADIGVTFTLSSSGSGSADLTASGLGMDTYSSIDHIVGSDHADVLTTERSSGTEIYGLGGDDQLFGGSGSDRLDGGLGDDLLNGGTGSTDTATYAQSPGPVTVHLLAGTVTGAYGSDTLVDIERIIGSDFDDVLVGGTGSERLEGGPGDDWLEGGGGPNTLSGGTGNDTLVFSPATSRYYAGAGTDTLLLTGTGQTVDLVAMTDSGLSGVNDVSGIEVVSIVGGNSVIVDAVAGLAASTTDELFIEGVSGDTAYIGAGWTGPVPTVISGLTYDVYAQDGATLNVLQGVGVDTSPLAGLSPRWVQISVGQTLALTLTIPAPAPAGGAIYALSCSATFLTCPTQVTVAQGTTSIGFNAPTLATGNTPVAATQGATTYRARVSIVP